MLEHARTPADQDRCAAALERKCEILWRLLDAIEAAHMPPALRECAQLRGTPMRSRWSCCRSARSSRGGSGREILELCDGKRSAVAIASALRERHPDVAGIEADVHEFLDEMRRLGVLGAAQPAA